MATNLCPICSSKLQNLRASRPVKSSVSARPLDYTMGPEAAHYDCPLCGVFSLTMSALPVILEKISASKRRSAVLSHAVRKAQRGRRDPLLDEEFVLKILEMDRLPSPSEQVDNLVAWLAENAEYPGHKLILSPTPNRADIGAPSDEAWFMIVKHLLDRKLADGSIYPGGRNATLNLSVEGWSYYDEIARKGFRTRKAVMAMPFGYEALNNVYDTCFKPAVKRTGFELIRLDEAAPAGSIDDRLRVEIRTSRFLIADLTLGNQGAYWEAGFAEGIGKPVIYTCERSFFKQEPPYQDSGGIHFDTGHLHTVIWDYGDTAAAAQSLATTIRATLPDEARMADEI